VGQAQAHAHWLRDTVALPRWPESLKRGRINGRHAFILGRLSLVIDLGHVAHYRTMLTLIVAQMARAP
jgi:hypothetical protein